MNCDQLKSERDVADVVSNRYLEIKFPRLSLLAFFILSREKRSCSFKVQLWRNDSSFLGKSVVGGGFDVLVLLLISEARPR